jgi:hypothetical protein
VTDKVEHATSEDGTVVQPVYGAAVSVYRAAGWESVLPLPPGEKTPPPSGFTGRYGRVPTEDEYKEWRSQRGGSNVCIRMPDNVIGIDVDNYSRKTGDANLEQFIADNELPPLPPTWTSSARPAPSGIKWYTVDHGLRFVPEVCADVDLIQSGHRYALVWPSIHPDGSEYEWRDPKGKAVPSGDVPRLGELTELPREWMDALMVIGGSTGAGPREGRLPDRTDVEEILDEADTIWDSEVRGTWKNTYERVWQRYVESARSSTRHSAMLRATAIVVGDVLSGAMPGRAVHLLAEDCKQAYEDPLTAGLGLKDSKTWSGSKEQDFWSQVGGAIGQYEGDWSERIYEARDETLAVSSMADAVSTVKENLMDMHSSEYSERDTDEPTAHADDDEEVSDDLLDWLLGPSTMVPAVIETEPGSSTIDQVASAVIEASTDHTGRHVDVLDNDPRVWDAFIRLGRRWVADETDSTDRLQKALIAGLPISNEAVRWMPEVDRKKAAELWAEARQVVQTADRLVKPGSFIARVLPHYVDDDWVPESCVVTLVAPPSGGKTAVAVDMACKVTLGARWFGHTTQRTPVLFLAFEAEVSTRNRIAGWCEKNRTLLAAAPDDRVKDGQPSWLYMTGMETPLSSEAGLMVIESQMQSVREETGEDVGLIFVDTLAASFGGGDENSARDMHAVLDNLAKLRAAWPRMTIVLLHHPTKDSSRYEFSSGRGSGALRGTAQVELSTALVDGSDQVKVGRTKSRDGRAGDDVFIEGSLQMTRLRGSDGTWLRKPDGGYAETVVFVEYTEGERASRASEMILRQARAEQARHDAIWAVLEEARSTGGSVQADQVRRRVKELFPGVELGATAEARALVSETKAQHKNWLAGLAEVSDGAVAEPVVPVADYVIELDDDDAEEM